MTHLSRDGLPSPQKHPPATEPVEMGSLPVSNMHQNHLSESESSLDEGPDISRQFIGPTSFPESRNHQGASVDSEAPLFTHACQTYSQRSKCRGGSSTSSLRCPGASTDTLIRECGVRVMGHGRTLSVSHYGQGLLTVHEQTIKILIMEAVCPNRYPSGVSHLCIFNKVCKISICDEELLKPDCFNAI